MSSPIYSKITNQLLFLFPIVLLLVKLAGDLILISLLFMGIYSIINFKINPFKDNRLKLFSYLTVGYFLVVAISVVNSDAPSALVHYLSRELYFLFAPFIVLAVHQAKIDFDYLIFGIKLGLILLGILMLGESIANPENRRVSWDIAPGIYGNLSVVLLLFSLINITNETKNQLLLTGLSTFFGLNSIMLSGTRSAVLVLLALSIVLFLLLNKNAINKKRIYLFAIFFVVCSSILLFINNNINSRLLPAFTEVSQWQNNENINSSSGIRMEMYKTGLLAFIQKPILGYGYRNTTKPASEFINKKSNPKDISQYNHLHNTYINTLVYGGITALIMLLLLLFLPLKQFWQHFVHKKQTNYAILGILLCASYILLGVTNTALGGVFENSLFVFFLAIILPKCSTKNMS